MAVCSMKSHCRIGLWLSVVVVGFTQVSEAQAQSFFSTNEIVPYCQEFLEGREAIIKDPTGTGQCFGSVQTVVTLGQVLAPPFRFCMPDGATLRQAMRVVVTFALSHPENMHLPFPVVASQALANAWPCGGKR
jgi:hypothetical protein